MALDKKATMYSGHAAYGSAEELDAYGVWVKSEPQDLTSSLAGAVGLEFGGGAMPYDADYDAGYDGMGVSGTGFSDIDSEAPHIGLGMGDFSVAGFGEEMPAGGDQEMHEGVSTQILAKIADDLTTIRSDLSTIKRELEGGRAEAEDDGGFYADEDDEKIALSGDEMDTILTSSGYSGEEDFSFDSQREADAVRLRKLSERNEASTVSAAGGDAADGEEEEEIIDIDLENLGIDLDAEIEKIQLEAQADEGPGESQGELQGESLGESPEVLELAQEPLLGEELSSFDPLDEIDEMRNLRLEGVDHLSPVPDGTAYLEEYPYASESTEFDLSPAEDSTPDLNFDDASFSLGGFPEDELSAENQFAPLDLSGVVLEEPDFSSGLIEPGLSEPELAVPDFDEPELISLEEPLLDDISMGAKELEASVTEDDSLAQIIPEGFELEQQEEAAAPFDEDLEVIVEEDAAQLEDSAGMGMADTADEISPELKTELKNVLTYMDHLLESLPEEKIEEFAQSEHFDSYKKIFKELGLT